MQAAAPYLPLGRLRASRQSMQRILGAQLQSLETRNFEKIGRTPECFEAEPLVDPLMDLGKSECPGRHVGLLIESLSIGHPMG